MNNINGERICRRIGGRPIPKRGQVKMGIMVGIVHTVTSIFSHGHGHGHGHGHSSSQKPSEGFSISDQAMEADEADCVFPFQLQFDKPIASQVKIAEWKPERIC
ncbi:Anaphase-promoting complex subunit 4, partial [Cucurbita argyrosperma subsp. argyrosperma]